MAPIQCHDQACNASCAGNQLQIEQLQLSCTKLPGKPDNAADWRIVNMIYALNQLARGNREGVH